MSLRTSPQTGVAIPRSFRKPECNAHWREPFQGFPPVTIPEIFRELRTNALVRERPRLPCVKGAVMALRETAMTA